MHIPSGDVEAKIFKSLMTLVTPAKYKELVEAIRNRDFPVVVHGPSGSGKTHSILRALKELGLRPRYVDLSRTTVNRSLDPRTVVLVQLYNCRDLERIRYCKSVIIESNLGGLSKLCGYRLIKFNRVTERMARRHGIQDFDGNLFSLGTSIPQRRHEIDIFRLLGKIFYKKICVADLSVVDGFVHYSTGPMDFQDCSEVWCGFKEDARLLSYHPTGDSVRDLKSVVAPLPGMSNVLLSVETWKVEQYLFANFLHFSSPGDFVEIYDCLSLMDMDPMGILVFVQCMKEKEQVGSGGFYSFTLETGCGSGKGSESGSVAETLDFLL